MLRTLMLGLALCGCSASYSHFSSSGYTFDFQGKTAERSESGEIAQGIRELEVDHLFGEVDIAAVGPGEPTGWAWTVQTWCNDQSDAERFAQEVTLVRTPHEDGMAWRLELPENPGRELRGVRSFLTLRVDPDCSLELVNRHSGTKVVGLRGAIEATLEYGKCMLADLPGMLAVKQRHGDLELLHCGPVQLEMQHGDLQMDGVAGELELELAHGDASIAAVTGNLDLDLQHGDAQVSSSGAQVEIEIAHGDLQLDTGAGVGGSISGQHGDINLRLHPECKTPIMANAEFGKVNSEVPVFRNSPGPGPVLELEAQHGDVNIQRRK